MQISLRFILSLLTFQVITCTFGQSGWDYIKADDNKEAKKAFLQTLAKDSTDLKAIQGMIFLCDIEDNDLDYDKYANKLLTHHFNNHYYTLFENSSTEDGNKILGRTDIDARFKLKYQLGKALKLKRDRNFDGYQNLIDQTINNFEWAYIGPFKNINGYGHIKQFDIENDNFDTLKTYTNRDKVNLNWFTPLHPHPIKSLDFDDFLMEDKHGSTYYANSFFETDQTQDIQLSISRKYPIKIWLDNDLIFDNNDFIRFNWDAETVSLSLPKGNHRILVKYSKSDYFTGISNTYNNSIQEYGYQDYGRRIASELNDDNYFAPYGRQDLVIRLHDEKGKAIPIKSSNLNSEFTPSEYSSTTSRLPTIDYFKALIDQDSSDWFNYYMLSNAYFKYGITDEIEYYFTKVLAEKPHVFFKFIMFQLYNINGKKEKGFVTLSNINHDATPVFSVLKKELTELDPTNQAKEYESALLKMTALSPSNRYAIRTLLHFYNKHGRVKERIDFAQKTIEQFEQYAKWLEEYTQEDFKPNDYYIGKKETKKKPNQELRQAKKEVQRVFNAYNYEALIKKYKAKENEKKVLQLYDEYLAMNAWNTSKQIDKAKYLFNLERYPEAIKELETVLKTQAYDGEVYELLGDIYNHQKKDSIALSYYKKARHLENVGASYGGIKLAEKIAQIDGQQKLKQKFKSFEFRDWIADESWINNYKNEESVIVGYTSDVYLSEDGSVKKYSKMLIKILTEAGATSWTEYNFSRIGSIKYIKVIKPSGAELFPDVNGSFVVFKNLKIGDYILFETEDAFTPKNELGSYLHGFQDMVFQAPLNFVKFEVIIPKDQELHYILHKLENDLEESIDNDSKHYTWTYKHLPKQVQEEAILDYYDTYTHIQYNTLSDWSPVVEWYNAKTYRKLESNYEIRAILDTIIQPEMSNKEKVISIYNFITKEITYSYTRLLQSGYIPKNTELTCSGQVGDCKDVATLMISMLKQLNIEAYYVLVKTNNMFHQKTLPSLYFDHVIAGVDLDGTTEYFDLTTDFYPYYVTNENDMNAWALKIKPNETNIFQLPNDYLNPKKNLVTHLIDATVSLDKTVELKVKSTFEGMKSGRIREIYHNKPKADMGNAILDILGQGVFKNIVLQHYDFKHPKEFTIPFEAEFTLTAKKHADNVLDIYFMTIPYMIGIETNTAILTEKRYNTLNLHEITKIEPCKQEVVIHFPKGMKLYKLPQNIMEDSKWASYKVEFEEIEDGIKVTKFQQFKVDTIPTSEFNDFKDFYLELLELDKTKIVFNSK